MKRTFFFLMALSLLLYPVQSLADGMIMPPPEQWIQETDQEAVILYDQGVETLVLSITFQGDADDFGWVVPTPSKPEVTKGSDRLFDNLEKYTGYYHYDRPVPAPNLSLGAKDESAVQIIETKKIDYYDVTVLSSTDEDALAEWLNENGYTFPESASYILNSYVENGWYFVAMQINPKALGWADVEEQLRTGHATPVVLEFETDTIVYPLRISSIVGQTEPSTGSDTPEYYTGKIGKAIKVRSEDAASSYNDSLSISAQDVMNGARGTISLWFNPEWQVDWASTMDLVSVRDVNGVDAFHYRIKYDEYEDMHYFELRRYVDTTVYYWNSEPMEIPESTWQHTAVAWEQGSEPALYYNGAPLPLTSSAVSDDADLTQEGVYDNATLYLGKSGVRKLLFDEVAVYDTVQTASDINVDYLQVDNGNALTVEDPMTLLAHFDSDLRDEVSGDDFTFMGRKTAVQDYEITNPYYSEYVGVVLYIMADGRKTLPSFSTDYANWISKNAVRELALDDQGAPLLNPSGKKYFLTKLTRTMTYSDMTEDLFPQDAKTNSTIGQPIGTTGPDTRTPFYIMIGTAIAVSIGLAVTILVISRKKPVISK